MRLVREIWQMLTRAQRRWVVAAQAISLLMALSTLAGVAAITPFFAVLADPRLVANTAALHWLYVELGFHTTHGFLVALGLGFLAMVLLSNCLNMLGSYGLLRLALWIGDDLRAALFREYLHRNFLFHARTNSSTVYSNVSHETVRIAFGILQPAFVLLTSLLTAILILVSIVVVDPVGGVVVISGLFGGYLLIYVAVQRSVLRLGRLESELMAQRTQLLLEALGGIKEIILSFKQEFFQRRAEHADNLLSRVAARIDAITNSPRHIMESMAAAGLVGYGLILSGSARGIGQTLAQLTFLAFCAYRLLPALQQAFASVVKIRAARAGFDSVSADLLAARAPRKQGTAVAVPVDEPTHEITLTNVWFRYAAHSPPALHDVSLSIPAGSFVGLVGSNGSGKTTLVDVLAGLLIPDRGQVQIDGVPLQESNLRAWQSRIAYVPQGVFLLDSTIAENIALGTALEDIDTERMRTAARLAQLDELVASLADGYRERVGERGIRLSGGQRQRLGIARGLYREAAVLILDEPINALDGIAAEQVMAAVRALRGKKTIILVAHQLVTMRECDMIFELENGSLVRQGSWNDLLGRSRRFALAASANGPVP